MPHLHLYVSDDVATELRGRARKRDTSLSKMLAEIVTRDARRTWPEGWLDQVARAARAFGRVAASLRTSGRTGKARSYDAMVAAIAMANDLPLYAANPADFVGIDGLDVHAVPVSHIDR